jgi:hypothetical protein
MVLYFITYTDGTKEERTFADHKEAAQWVQMEGDHVNTVFFSGQVEDEWA